VNSRLATSYLEKDSDKIRTILSGAPLTAENIRMMHINLGSEWAGTSWYFAEHIIAKELTRSTEIPFEAVYGTAANYGVTVWLDKKHLKKKLETVADVFYKKGYANIEVKADGSLKSGGLISPSEFRSFALSQYEHAMGEGLTKYNPYSYQWEKRDMSNFAERILWHYLMSVFDRPRVHDSPNGESTLNALYTSVRNRMLKLNPQVWGDLSPHTLALLVGWERNLLSKNILKLFSFGDTQFVAPLFYADIDKRIISSAGKFSADKHERILELVEKLRKMPSHPVMLGTPEYEMAVSLQRVGAIKVVEDSKDINSLNYVYLVSRDLFEKFDKDMRYRYSENPFKEFGDSSITDSFFQALGRARLFGQKILPELRLVNFDFKGKIDKMITNLEEAGSTSVPEEIDANIFSPLGLVGALSVNTDSITVAEDKSFLIRSFADYWSNLVNDPTLLDIKFPPDETIRRKEHSQTENQLKRNLNRYFS
jgi:hypothetical protein